MEKKFPNPYSNESGVGSMAANLIGQQLKSFSFLTLLAAKSGAESTNMLDLDGDDEDLLFH